MIHLIHPYIDISRYRMIELYELNIFVLLARRTMMSINRRPEWKYMRIRETIAYEEWRPTLVRREIATTNDIESTFSVGEISFAAVTCAYLLLVREPSHRVHNGLPSTTTHYVGKFFFTIIRYLDSTRATTHIQTWNKGGSDGCGWKPFCWQLPMKFNP